MRPERTFVVLALRASVCGAALWLAACGGRDISLGDGLPEADGSVPSLEPFSEPAPIVELAAPGAPDDDPTLSADLTLILFNSEREGGSGEEDIWFSTRERVADRWAAPQPVSELNTPDRETGISLSSDGLTIWFSSDRPGGMGGLDVYTARRQRRADSWSAVERVEAVSSSGDDLISAVEPSQRVLYLARRDDDDQAYDLFAARRDSADLTWGVPEPLTLLNTQAAESDAFAFQGGKALVFTRGEDLMLAERANVSEPFQSALLWRELNSDSDERDAWVSTDGRHVVFSSNRSGEYQLYEAAR